MAAELADVVGPSGAVIAVDQAADTLAMAGQLLAARGVHNVEIRRGDAAATCLRPGTIDTAVIRHVLAHNGGREQQIVDHAATLVRPGGTVLLVDVDLTAHRLRPPDSDWDDMQRAYVRFHQSRGNHPRVGLRLGDLLRAAGLCVTADQSWYLTVAATPGVRPPAWVARQAMVEAGCVTGPDLERWRDALERLDRSADPPTIVVPMFAAAGTSP